MSSPRTCHEYLLSVRDALVQRVAEAPTGGEWAGVEIHADQRYGLRGQNGLAGATGRGTLNLSMEGERSGDWADGDPSFIGFGLSVEIMLPAKTAAQWDAQEKRISQMVADLREDVEVIEGTNGAVEWAVDYTIAEPGGATYMVAVIQWRSSEG